MAMSTVNSTSDNWFICTMSLHVGFRVEGRACGVDASDFEGCGVGESWSFGALGLQGCVGVLVLRVWDESLASITPQASAGKVERRVWKNPLKNRV